MGWPTPHPLLEFAEDLRPQERRHPQDLQDQQRVTAQVAVLGVEPVAGAGLDAKVREPVGRLDVDEGDADVHGAHQPPGRIGRHPGRRPGQGGHLHGVHEERRDVVPGAVLGGAASLLFFRPLQLASKGHPRSLPRDSCQGKRVVAVKFHGGTKAKEEEWHRAGVLDSRWRCRRADGHHVQGLRGADGPQGPRHGPEAPGHAGIQGQRGPARSIRGHGRGVRHGRRRGRGPMGSLPVHHLRHGPVHLGRGSGHQGRHLGDGQGVRQAHGAAVGSLRRHLRRRRGGRGGRRR